MNLTNVLCSILTKDLLPSSLCWVSCTQFHPINSFWWWTNSNQHSSPSLKGGNLYSRLSTGHFLSNVPKWRKTWQLSFSHPCFFFSPLPAHICARFYPFNLFLPIIPFLPSASPQNSSPSLTHTSESCLLHALSLCRWPFKMHCLPFHVLYFLFPCRTTILFLQNWF